jgi:hypothetical protein
MRYWYCIGRIVNEGILISFYVVSRVLVPTFFGVGFRILIGNWMLGLFRETIPSDGNEGMDISRRIIFSKSAFATLIDKLDIIWALGVLDGYGIAGIRDCIIGV